MRFAVLPFAFASLTPVALLGYGAFTGGWAIWAALIYTSFLAFALDQILPWGDGGGAEGTEFPTAKALSVALALGHLALVPLGVMAVAGFSGLGTGERVAAFFAFGLYFGQVSNSNAHELIHRSNRHLFNLGKWVYISLLYGHHTTAHRLLHHAHVATPLDPNFPPKGRSFYRYFLRGWVGSFMQGWRVEQLRSQRSGKRNPYIDYIGGGLTLALLCLIVFGWAGLAAYLGLCFYAQSQLAMVDYLQHYGLARRKLEDGSYEPQGPQHSWNSPHWFSSHMMVNASRHSDHHANPGRIYPALRLTGDMPLLPYSLPAMGIVALIPPLWFKLMDKRVDRIIGTHTGAVPA